MKNEIHLHTRREFLRRTVLTSALSWTVPTFLANTFSSLQADAMDRATQKLMPMCERGFEKYEDGVAAQEQACALLRRLQAEGLYR